ncbi:MAG TPA: Fic family protein [Candidatus Krumholzibacteria bacterium]|nr:Fic family protein [Candidatus Krumholzibacteria bacterium]
MSPFHHYDLALVAPEFGSTLNGKIQELQYLRRWQLSGSTPPPAFFDLKSVFQFLENLRSARVEGNQTTVQELVDAKIAPPPRKSEGLKEIENMEAAMAFVEDAVEPGGGVSRGLILEIHKLVVSGLTREGDVSPGQFRLRNLAITGSDHTPPDFTQVDPYVDELVSFYNKGDDPQFDLIKVALAHHRFAWIHPFGNGNGRTARLLTYAMLIERGYDVRQGRILNPSAVIGQDRTEYYRHLAFADSGETVGALAWTEYFLTGLLIDMRRIDRLLDYKYLSGSILKPAIRFCLDRGLVSEIHASILEVAVDVPVFRSSDIKHLVKLPVARSREINALLDAKLVQRVGPNARRYRMRYTSSVLLRGVISSLMAEGFIGVNE